MVISILKKEDLIKYVYQNGNNIIFKPFHNNSDFKSSFFGFDTNFFSNKIKKDSENIKLKLVETKLI